ncbi:hypothetical protein [Methanococcus voltae]|uniref:Uncharacterized protein n=2 Tax=Methanococcus voltae TaxID=2188 RepID=A0A8J7RNA0_METVO|nr:hypothetical protein [Methanococcus voltae]MBP2171743.1 hypothetical protein [Methanococcus voltae]MBP2201319.1 hypothetical protein [Methanococcus voltae]MCS3922739.1 hypothetical protein [Methanococcus voltae PS]
MTGDEFTNIIIGFYIFAIFIAIILLGKVIWDRYKNKDDSKYDKIRK